MSYKRMIPAAVLTALVAASAAAQDSASTRGRFHLLGDFVRRSSLDIAGSQARPQDALARNIGLGDGMSGA